MIYFAHFVDGEFESVDTYKKPEFAAGTVDDIKLGSGPVVVDVDKKNANNLGLQYCPECGYIRAYPETPDAWANNGGLCYQCR